MIAAIEEAEHFGPRLRRESDRLNVTAQPSVTVLGDGAEWIWNLASDHLPQAAWALDIYHLLERVGGAMKGMGGSEEAIRTRCESARRAVLSDGKSGFERWLGGAFAEFSTERQRSPCWTWRRMRRSPRRDWVMRTAWRRAEVSAVGPWKGGSNRS